MKRAWIAIGATAVLVMAVAGSASATAVFITSYETTDDGDLIVHDQVVSDEKKCLKHRKVTLRRKLPGGGAVQVEQNVGSDITDKDGKSKIVVEDAKDGTYYEKLKEKETDRVECEGAKSKKIEVDFPK